MSSRNQHQIDIHLASLVYDQNEADHGSQAKSGVPSDPYLMTGYDKKTLTLSSDTATEVRVEVDIDGTGNWHLYKTMAVEPDNPATHQFPDAFQAYWVRLVSSNDAVVTGQLAYQ